MLEGCKLVLLASLHPSNTFLYPPNFKFLEITLSCVCVCANIGVWGRRCTISLTKRTLGCRRSAINHANYFSLLAIYNERCPAGMKERVRWSRKGDRCGSKELTPVTKANKFKLTNSEWFWPTFGVHPRLLTGEGIVETIRFSLLWSLDWSLSGVERVFTVYRIGPSSCLANIESSEVWGTSC